MGIISYFIYLISRVGELIESLHTTRECMLGAEVWQAVSGDILKVTAATREESNTVPTSSVFYYFIALGGFTPFSSIFLFYFQRLTWLLNSTFQLVGNCSSKQKKPLIVYPLVIPVSPWSFIFFPVLFSSRTRSCYFIMFQSACTWRARRSGCMPRVHPSSSGFKAGHCPSDTVNRILLTPSTSEMRRGEKWEEEERDDEMERSRQDWSK